MKSLRIFEIDEPVELLSPFILNSPHSGLEYPEKFLEEAVLSHEQLRKGEDTAVDVLFKKAVPAGAYFMKALFPRSFIDLNREPYELDPNMFDGKLPNHINTHSVRAAGGLGVIPRIIGKNTSIYNKLLHVDHGLERIENYYKPYHSVLQFLLAKIKSRFGFYVLIDCHSMPSTFAKLNKQSQKDIIIGDRFGQSCSQVLTEIFEIESKKLGYHVTRNIPYAGGYITEYYGTPKIQGHAIQIEINRALYMDEKTLELKKNFSVLQLDLQKIIYKLSILNASDLAPFSSAAE